MDDDESLRVKGYPKPFPLSKLKPFLTLFTRDGDFEPSGSDYGKIIQDWVDSGAFDVMRVVIICHCLQERVTTEWMTVMTSELLEADDQVIVLLDWSGGEGGPMTKYTNAAANTLVVGNWLGEIAEDLKRRRPDMDFWGIGHGLGAHVIGKAGRVSGCFSRITGLDPAGPGFETSDQRLQATDAFGMVDVIHTDGFSRDKPDSSDETVPVNHFGTLLPMGTHDFYPNFGLAMQPGAATIFGSHHRSVQLFNWSIGKEGKFMTNLALAETPGPKKPVTKTKQVNFQAEMGYYAYNSPPNDEGFAFYILTNPVPPWAPANQAVIKGIGAVTKLGKFLFKKFVF